MRTPTVNPASRGSGAGLPVRTDHIRATSSTVRAIGPTVSSVGQSGKTPSVEIAPQRLFSPTVPQQAEGRRIEHPVSVPRPRSQSPAARAAAFPSARAAGRPPWVERVLDRAVPGVLARDAPRELVQIRLADDDCSCVDEGLHGGGSAIGHVVCVDLRAVRRADSGGVEQILDEERLPREWARFRLSWVVDPADDRVERISLGRRQPLRPRSSHPVSRARSPRRVCSPDVTRRTLPGARD